MPDPQTIGEILTDAFQRAAVEHAKEHFFRGVVHIMREDKVGVEPALKRFRAHTTDLLDADPDADDELRALMGHEFDACADWLREKVRQAREFVELAEQS